MWNDLLSALALVLVIEGLLPFIAPSKWRNAMQRLSETGDKQLRGIALTSMMLGIVLLYLIRG